ncbi:hypothetical protein D3C79_867320 [compost metagenome]
MAKQKSSPNVLKIIPATAGPAIRAKLVIVEFNAIAFGKSSLLSTMSTIIDCLQVTSNALMIPCARLRSRMVGML